MNIVQKVVARRYAVAYVNVFDSTLNKGNVMHIKDAVPFFKRHKRALYFLTLPTLTREQKITAMADVMQKLQMPPSLTKLLDLLIRHKRAGLWCDVLETLVSYYYDKHQMAIAVIESFPELLQEHKEDIEESFARLLKKEVFYTYVVRPDLISGVCVKTNNLMWEDSIAKKLRTVRSAVLERYKG